MQETSVVNGVAQEPWRVLVVDDEPAIAEEIVEYFGGRGIVTEAVVDAAAALARVRTDPTIMVMVTDVRMPGTDGLTLASKALAGRGDQQALEVIVLTGHASFDMAVDAVRSRVFDFVRKPVGLRELAETVLRAQAAAAFRRARVRINAARTADLTAEAQALRRDVERLSRPGAASGGALAADGGRVLAMINDELRARLVPIIGLAERIERQSGPLAEDQLADYGTLIHRSAERLREVAHAFAMLSTLSLGIGAPYLSPETSGAILAELRTRHEQDAALRGVTLSVAQAGEHTLLTDRRLLAQALDQLVSNAVRFSATGGRVRLSSARLAGEHAFSVEDDGPGMAPDAVALAMQPFGPIDQSAARGGGGIGLGLTLAGRLAEALGGRLEIRSRQGVGTAATIVVPAAQPA